MNIDGILSGATKTVIGGTGVGKYSGRDDVVLVGGEASLR